MRSCLSLFVAVLTAVSALAPAVHAQAWLSDRSRTEGIGIRAGNLEIHPGVGAEIGYDSNVFLRDGRDDSVAATGTTPAFVDRLPEGSAVLRVTPHLYLSTLGRERAGGDTSAADPLVDFRLGVNTPVYYYFSTQQRGRFAANADMDLKLLPRRVASFELTGGYTRTVRPFGDGRSNASFGRNNLRAAPRVLFQTRGGVLKVGVGGDFQYDVFDESDFSVYNAATYGAKLDVSWEFLPKTALIYEARAARRAFERNSTLGDDGPLRNDGTAYAYRLGINGALSARISATLMAGYTALFFDEGIAGSSRDAFTLAAGVRWNASDSISAAIGFERAAGVSFIGNYQTTNRGNARIELLAARAFLFSLNGYVALVTFGTDPIVEDQVREDLRVGVDLSAEYRATNWLAFTANAGVLTNFSDSQIVRTTVPIVDPVEFTRFEAFFGTRISY